VCGFLYAAPVSLTLAGGVDSMAYQTSARTPLNGAIFVPTMTPIADGRVDAQFMSFLDFDIGYTLDAVLQHMAYGDMVANMGVFRFGLGGFYGFVPSNFSATGGGINITAGLNFAGYFFLEGKVFSSIASRDAVSGFSRSGIDAKLGFWASGVRTYVFYKNKTYIDRSSDTMFTDTARSEYGLMVNFSTKAIPFQIDLGGGYITFDRTYTPYDKSSGKKGSDTKESLTAVGVHLGLHFEFSHAVRWNLAGEGDISIGGVGSGNFMFAAETGFTFTLSS
jgi:hypothetical protein